jgi:hypothetical protein
MISSASVFATWRSASRRRLRRRWPGVSARAPALGGPARRTPGHTPRRVQVKMAQSNTGKARGEAVFPSLSVSQSQPPRQGRLRRRMRSLRHPGLADRSQGIRRLRGRRGRSSHQLRPDHEYWAPMAITRMPIRRRIRHPASGTGSGHRYKHPPGPRRPGRHQLASQECPSKLVVPSPRCPIVSAMSAESRPGHYAVASRALTRRPRPEGWQLSREREEQGTRRRARREARKPAGHLPDLCTDLCTRRSGTA